MFKLTKRASHYGQTDRSTLIIKSFAFKNVLLKPVTSLQIIPCIAKTKFRCREKMLGCLTKKVRCAFFLRHTHIRIFRYDYLYILHFYGLPLVLMGRQKSITHTHTHTRAHTNTPKNVQFPL